METLYNLTLAVSGLFAAGCGFRLISLAIGMALGGEGNKRQYFVRIKNTLIVFVIALSVGVGGGVIRAVLAQYFT